MIVEPKPNGTWTQEEITAYNERLRQNWLADQAAQKAKIEADKITAQIAEAEVKRIAAAKKQQDIIAGIAPEAEAMKTSILGQTEADKARIETLVAEYTKPVDTTARVTAEQAKVNAETGQALTDVEKKIRSEAALRGGLYSGGYISAMGEAETTAALSKIQRMATFQDILAKEQEDRGKLGLAYTMDLYKTHAANVYQSYQTAYNIVTDKAKMAQQAGQFDEQLAWEQEATKINQDFQSNIQTAQITAQKQMADAEASLKLLLANKEEIQRQLDRAFTAGENEKARDLQLQIAEMNKEIGIRQAEATQTAGLWSGIGAIVGTAAGFLIKSDRRLKKNIKYIGTHNLEIGIYEFQYIWDTVIKHIGVMSDEVRKVRPEAVIVGADGFDIVNYSLL